MNQNLKSVSQYLERKTTKRLRLRERTSKWLTKLVAGNAASLAAVVAFLSNAESVQGLSRIQLIGLNLSALCFAIALVPIIMTAVFVDIAEEDQPLHTQTEFKKMTAWLQIGTFGFILGIGLVIGCVVNVTLVNVGKLLFI